MKKTGDGNGFRPHPALLALLDLLLALLILLVYAFFQYGLPALRPAPPVQPSPTVSAPTQAPVSQETPPPEEDNRNPWQIRFAEHFTEETVRTDHSYTSPNVSATRETVTVGEGRNQIVYHVADIYVASPENFCTYTANNELRYYSVQDAMEMDRDSGAIVSISGDQYSYQGNGFLVRNGQVYKKGYAYCDICVLFDDGRIEMYRPDSYNVDELLEQGAVQVWNFGPSLLDENGQPYESYSVSTAVSFPNPRSALGYYEPGHYCFVVVDGRQEEYSKGMTIPELAQVFQDLGCVSAYNLDGGGSALMLFNHERYSRQSNGADRELGDILLIKEIEE